MDDPIQWPQRRQDFIGRVSRSPGVVGNKWVVAGTRIPTAIIWSLHKAGYTDEEIVAEYPIITLEDVRAALEHERQEKASRTRNQHQVA